MTTKPPQCEVMTNGVRCERPADMSTGDIIVLMCSECREEMKALAKKHKEAL